jgi:hypothetical protein
MTHPRLALALFLLAPAAHAQNTPPIAAPDLLSPMGNAPLEAGPVRFTWTNQNDPLGGRVRYELEVVEVVAAGRDARRVAQATAGDGTEGVILDGLPWGPLSWRARTVDDIGQASDWSAPAQFTVLAPSAAAPHAADAGGCDVGAGRATPWPWLSLPLVAWLLLRRRRFI